MTHEILERLFSMVLRYENPTILELSLEQYKRLKVELDITEDMNEFLDLKIVIKQTSRIHVR